VIDRQTIIDHILMMKTLDPDYARDALRWYHTLMPWMDLNTGIRQAMKAAA
jgi:hypothetical protein